MFKIIGTDQHEYGPASVEQLRLWLAEGRINSRTLAQRQGGNEWKPLGAYPEFAAPGAFPGGLPPVMGAPGSAEHAGSLADQINAANRDFDFGGCLGRSLELLKANFGLL